MRWNASSWRSARTPSSQRSGLRRTAGNWTVARFCSSHFPKGTRSMTSPGGSFVRVGSAKQPMAPDERMRLAQRRGQARFISFDEQTMAGTGFATLDERLWKPLLSAEGLDDPQLGLEKLGLLATDEHGAVQATVAGVLTCTQQPEQFLRGAGIAAVRYRGTDRCVGSSGRAGNQWSDQPSDHSSAGLRRAKHACRRAQGPRSGRTCRNTAREPYTRSGERGCASRLLIRGSRIRLSIFSDRLELCSRARFPTA